MGDLINSLKGVGDTINQGALALKNYAAPPGPGRAAPALIDTPSGKARIDPNGGPPILINPPPEQTPVPRAKGGCVTAGGARAKGGSVMKGGAPMCKNVDNSGLKKEPC